jgi:hypothetical protein
MTHLPTALADDGDADLPAVREQRMPAGLTARRKKLIDAMVWQGMSRQQAAAAAEMTDRNARIALADGRVLRYFRQQLSALREGARPRAVHRLCALSDQDRSLKVAVDASKALLHEPTGTIVNVGIGVGVSVKPGYIIDVSRHAEKARALLAASGSGAVAGGVDHVVEDDEPHLIDEELADA